MRANDLHRVIGIIGTIDRENDSAMIQIEQYLLEGYECGAFATRRKPYAFHSVLADDASPERVVEIKYDRFFHSGK